MTLKNRLSKLEKTKRGITAEVECICFPPEEPPRVELRAETEAVAAVSCPIHGKRFKHFADRVYRAIFVPTHLDPHWRISHSPQYVKAMEASFPSDRWPATKIGEPDGAVRFVLKDGTEIHRMPPPDPVYDYDSGEIIGVAEGCPPKLRRVSREEPA